MHSRTAGKTLKSGRFGAQSIIFVVGLVVAVVMIIATYEQLVGSRSDARLLAHALEVQNKLAGLRILVRRAEGDQRSYLLSGRAEDLDGFRGAAAAIMPALSELATITADDPRQQSSLASLAPTLARKVEEMAETIRVYDSGDRAAAIASMQTGQGRALTREIDTALDRMLRDEQQAVELHTIASERTSFWLVATRRFGIAILVGLVIMSIFLVRRANREREAALRALETANAGLESNVAERTAEIRRTVDVLDNTISTMAPAVIVIDTNVDVVLSNPVAARLLGISVGMTFESWAKTYGVFQADEVTPLPLEHRTFTRALRGEPVDNVEIFVRRVDAPKGCHLIANSRPLRDAAGVVTGAVLVYHDVTDMREIEHQLRQAQKLEAIGQLTGGVAHDFNNILTVITGTIEILARAVAHDPMLASVARMIDEAADRGAELTRRLVAFARKQPLEPRSTDINTLVVDSTNLLRPTLGEQVVIELMLDDDVWPALVDPSQLAAALINLALNARDAMPGGGRLTLESANVVLDRSYAEMNVDVRPGPYVMITVRDTGTGIPAAIRDKVFEPFFTTKDVGKGTGLGLSMVYGFVKQSGGHVGIESEQGHGTSIRLYLPRAHAADAVGAVGAVAPAMPLEGGKETILVVEDDALVRGYAIAQLESLDYATLAAENAAAALSIIDSGTHIDLMFTDVVMPGGANGRELAEAATRRRPNLKVLFTSGYSEDAIVHDGRLDAGVLLLAKPYRKADLARMVRLALGVGVAATAVEAGRTRAREPRQRNA